MKKTDSIRSKGLVTPYFINLKTGEKIPWPCRHNTISFDATHAMALAFGGDNSLIPNRIGIIYGDANATFDTIVRNQSWDSLTNELSEEGANVQVQPFSFSPSFESIYRSDINSSSDVTYPGWSVTFHAHSDSVTPGAISSASSGSGSDVSTFNSGTSIYQAVLLNESAGKYTILARVSLGNGANNYTKPDNFEVAIDWTIKFF
jgi:hypothetical protein